MSLILATGSNLGNRLENLHRVQKALAEKFILIAQSQVYESDAVDYLDQPSFYNQVLEFVLPKEPPMQVLKFLLDTEQNFGRVRDIDKGPRTVDIDIIFWHLEKIDEPGLCVPHPRWQERSFVVKPLQQLPFFQTVQKCFKIPTTFDVDAKPIS